MHPTTKRTIGSTPLQVTQLGLGGTALANMYSAVSPEQVVATIQAAHAAGIGYFDTAPLYGRGLSETRLGAGLATLAADVVVSTKVGYVLEPAAPSLSAGIFIEPLANTVRFDYSREATLRSIEGSLSRLGRDRVDIIYVHDPDESITLQPGRTPYERNHLAEVMAGAYPALHELRAQGVLGAIGVGMNQWEMLADFAREGEFDCFLLAGRYTLLDQTALPHLLPLCAERSISVVVGGPYNSGILATGAGAEAYYDYAPAPPEVLERTRRLEAVCARYAVPLPAAALQFPLGHPAVVAVIPGMRSPAEVRANAAYLAQPIPADYWAELHSLGLLDPAAPVPT